MTLTIEYEIPPMRAIYLAYCDADSEQDARDFIAENEPLWRIRKVTIQQEQTP